MMAGVLAAEASKAGAQVAWVAPTYTNSRPMWRFVELVAGQDKRVTVRRAEREIIMPGNGRLGVYTADNPVGLRGESFDIVMLDEAPQYKPEVWTDVVMPTLADRDGIAYLIGTPKGKNWFYLEYMRGLSGGDQMSFTAPSSANPNPMIQRAALLAKDRVSDRTYRQEWLAEFVSDGAFFVNIEACATAEPEEPKDGVQYAIGVDWARSSGGDYTVFTVLDTKARKMVSLHRYSGQAFDVQLDNLRRLWNKYNRGYIVAAARLLRAFSRSLSALRNHASASSRSVSLIDDPSLAKGRGHQGSWRLCPAFDFGGSVNHDVHGAGIGIEARDGCGGPVRGVRHPFPFPPTGPGRYRYPHRRGPASRRGRSGADEMRRRSFL